MTSDKPKAQNDTGAKQMRQIAKLVAALLQSPKLEDAAKSIGISVSTAYRIRQTQEFQTAYRKALAESVDQGNARLQQAYNPAVSTLLKIMVDPNGPVASRLRAADRVIESVRKIEQDDVKLRLERIEQLISNSQKGREFD